MADREDTTKFNKKLVALLAIIFFFIGGFFAKNLCNSDAVVLATDVEVAINYMTVNNPAKLILEERVKQAQERKAREEAEKQRLEEERRIAEERRLEEERRIAEEKRLEEERLKNSKIAYLTFDDGPSKVITPKILDILDKYDIKATFFVVGKMVDVNPDILKRIYNEGHSIGNHSYSHKYSYVYRSIDNFFQEIELTENALKNVLGDNFETSLIRLPGGSHSEYKKKFVNAAVEKGYKVYDWNALNGDAEGINLDKDILINRLKSTVRGKKDLIILMHDTDAKSTTAEALPAILDYLIGEGYIFKKLDQ